MAQVIRLNFTNKIDTRNYDSNYLWHFIISILMEKQFFFLTESYTFLIYLIDLLLEHKSLNLSDHKM